MPRAKLREVSTKHPDNACGFDMLIQNGPVYYSIEINDNVMFIYIQ